MELQLVFQFSFSPRASCVVMKIIMLAVVMILIMLMNIFSGWLLNYGGLMVMNINVCVDENCPSGWGPHSLRANRSLPGLQVCFLTLFLKTNNITFDIS